MRSRQRQRARIFLAFEGASEGAFCAWLHDLCNESGLNIHLDRPQRMMGGDPYGLVERAIKLRKQSRDSAGRGHRASLLLIDADRLDDGDPRSRDAIAIAEREDLVLIRQRPCFEGVLLRLHGECSRVFPQSASDAERRLAQLWPSYCKPPNRQQLASRFKLSDLVRAAGSDPEIARLLEVLGLPSE